MARGLFRYPLLVISFLGPFSAAGGERKCAVVLVPGAFGPGTSSRFLKEEDYFSEHRSYFLGRGCKVLIAAFPPDSTIEERGLMLRDQADRFRKKENIKSLILLAHSQAGLDARYALNALKLSHVSALITLGAPHTGTPLADWALDQKQRGTPLYWFLRALGYDLNHLPFLGEMTNSFLMKHAKYFVSVPGIKYASGRGTCLSGCHWGLELLQKLSAMGRGDGIVPAENQRWGDDLGEYDLDHIQEVGADSLKRPIRLKFLDKVWSFLNQT